MKLTTHLKGNRWSIQLCTGVMLLLFFGCDQQAPLEDVDAPVIQILSPQQGMSLESRDSVEIRVIFHENTQLHETGVWVWEADTKDYVANFLFHSHDTILEVNPKFFFPVGTPTNLELEIDASDHNGNTSSKTIQFQLLP